MVSKLDIEIVAHEIKNKLPKKIDIEIAAHETKNKILTPKVKKHGKNLWERFKEASIEAHERAERNPQRSLLARSRRFK